MANRERITLDLSDSDDATKGGDFTPLPKGWYKVVLYEVEEKETGENSKNPGSPYLRARLNVTEEGDYYGRVVFDNFIGLYKTEAAPFLAAKAEQLSRVVGLFEGEDRSKVILPFAEDVQGEEVEAYINLERDKYAEEQHAKEFGKAPDEPIFRNSVRHYRPVGGWPEVGESGAAKPKKGAKKIAL